MRALSLRRAGLAVAVALAATLALGASSGRASVGEASPEAAPVVGAAAGSRSGGVFELTSLNHRYEEMGTGLAPIRQGPITIQLSSPRHQLDLLSNRLELVPGADGSYGVTLDLEFSGGGALVADFDVSGVRSHLEDELEVPAQKRTLVARARISRTSAGYEVTPLELPATFEVTIHSRVGSQLVSACSSLAALGLVPTSCDSLGQALSTAVIPLPAPGETYLLEAERFSAADRRRLDDFLAKR